MKFHAGITKTAFAFLFMAVFLSCREKPVPVNASANKTQEDENPYVWEKSQGGWVISLKPEYAALPARPWSLYLYYSWNGKDDEKPFELNILTGDPAVLQDSSSIGITGETAFDFFPKKTSELQHGCKETFLAFHSEQWKKLPKYIAITANEKPGEDFIIVDIKLEFRSSNSGPLIADPGTMLHYPPSFFRNRSYETFSHNLYPSLLYLVSDSFAVQSQFLKRLAFFTEKAGFTGRLAEDREIAGLRDWFAHDYRSADLAAFYDLARKQNFPLNGSELYLRELLLDQGVIRDTGNSYTEGEGALLGFSVESKSRLPVYYVHESVHGLEFIIPQLQEVFLNFFNSLSNYEKVFIRDALLYRGYNVIKDRQLLASETAAYLLQQSPEETDTYFGEYVMPWYTEYHKDREVDYSETPYSDTVTVFLKENPGIFGRRSAVLKKEFFRLTGLGAENFYDLLPKDRLL